MNKPLIHSVYKALRRGWKRLTPEAQQALRNFVSSQRTAHGYAGPGGKEDKYYRQFGRVLEAVFSPWRLMFFQPRFVVEESVGRDSVYGLFMAFLANDTHRRSDDLRAKVAELAEIRQSGRLTTNAACCILVMQHQIEGRVNEEILAWLKERQDETGGFFASDKAPIPDILSTGVALFTLRLVGAASLDATDFVQAHFRLWDRDKKGTGGFTPTILDDYSDVEYCFYGLLGL